MLTKLLLKPNQLSSIRVFLKPAARRGDIFQQERSIFSNSNPSNTFQRKQVFQQKVHLTRKKLTTTVKMSDGDKQVSGAGNPPTRAKNDLSDMRKPYRDQDDGIEESQLPSKDPIKLFEAWFNMVKESGSVYEPNAFCICTASKDGQPSSRMVLLKGFDSDGFRFFTHYSSQKGQNIAENPKVSMLFYWDSFNRQVRIEGLAEKLPEQVGEDYFKRRPQSSQIGAAISDQSSLIESREALMKKYDTLKAELGDASPAKPKTWGGYLVRPKRFEFWQGNTNRVHDRLMFRRPSEDEQIDGKLTRPAEDGWFLERMLP